MPDPILLYGAYGYTGRLIAEAAREKGVELLLAGRDRGRLQALGKKLGLQVEACALDEAAKLEKLVARSSGVLHCAGPFSRTSEPMVRACLSVGRHYLDVTGEVEVFEALAKRDAQAKAKGIMLLPGVGFDVVPSDCLANHVSSRLEDAHWLTLAIHSRGAFSRGTLTTVVENLPKGSLVRREGKLVPQRTGELTRDIDYGSGPLPSMGIPWGDLVTAYRSTGIENIEVLTTVPSRVAPLIVGRLGPHLGSSLAQGLLHKVLARLPEGPTPSQRASGSSHMYAEVRNRAGKVVRARLHGPDTYTLTRETALHIASRVAKGEFKPGFQTPATVYGADLVLGLEGFEREDLE